jgi:hypothetical protein
VSKSEFDPESCYVFTRARPLPLLPRNPDDYIVWHESELRAPGGDDEPDEEEPKHLVAKAMWALVKCGSALNDEEPLFDVFDAAAGRHGVLHLGPRPQDSAASSARS